MTMHEVLLELEPAIHGQQLGPHGRVGHRQQSGRHAQGGGKFGGHLGQAQTLAQAGCPPQVDAQVAVAQLEPGRGAQAREHPGARPGLVADTPAGLLVGESGEGVEQRVQVRRHGQAVKLQVVPRVGHDGQVDTRIATRHPRRRRERQAVAELGTAVATGKDRDAQ
jgi:hypothetical protein